MKETQSAHHYSFENRDLFHAVCGVADSRVRELEKILQVELIPRGHAFIIKSDSPAHIQIARHFFESLESRFGDLDSVFPDKFDFTYILRQIQEREGAAVEGEQMGEDAIAALMKEKIFTNHRGRPIYPRTRNQAVYIHSIYHNHITFSLGPAGTGKTFLGIVAACRYLRQGEVDRIILTRPAVEAGESLGFLPGDLAQKVDPYLRPVYDALYECFGMEQVNEMLASNRIEIAPLAYMRGRTLDNSVIVLDEAQNCTLSQIKMFLTRLGKNSRMCIGGDVTQIDLQPGKSGLVRAVEMLQQIEGIGVVEFGREDIIRNPIVERIVQAFEKEYPRESGKHNV